VGVPHVVFLELREPSGVQRRVVDVLRKTFHTSQTSRGEVRGGAHPPTAARRKLFGWSPGCWEFEAHRLTKPQHRIPTPPIQSSRSGPHADCSSGVPHPGSQTVSFMPACLCFRGSSNIREDGILFDDGRLLGEALCFGSCCCSAVSFWLKFS